MWIKCIAQGHNISMQPRFKQSIAVSRNIHDQYAPMADNYALLFHAQINGAKHGAKAEMSVLGAQCRYVVVVDRSTAPTV